MKEDPHVERRAERRGQQKEWAELDDIGINMRHGKLVNSGSRSPNKLHSWDLKTTDPSNPEAR